MKNLLTIFAKFPKPCLKFQKICHEVRRPKYFLYYQWNGQKIYNEMHKFSRRAKLLTGIGWYQSLGIGVGHGFWYRSQPYSLEIIDILSDC